MPSRAQSQGGRPGVPVLWREWAREARVDAGHGPHLLLLELAAGIVGIERAYARRVKDGSGAAHALVVQPQDRATFRRDSPQQQPIGVLAAANVDIGDRDFCVRPIEKEFGRRPSYVG